MSVINDVATAVRTGWNRPVFRAFRTSPSGLIGLVIVALLVVVAIVAPILLSEQADHQDFAHVSEQPSAEFPLGTDQLGRSVLDRLLVATRLSLELGVASALIALVLGLAIGASTAILGRRGRAVVLRVIDTMIAFPAILVVIVITVILGKGALSVLVGVGVAFSFNYARLTSTLAMSVGGREYINAARVVGVRGPRLMMRYVLPNIAEPLTVAFSLSVAGAILTVSALSFLGLGVQPPQYDWGQMLAEGLPTIYLTPAAALAPALAIALAALGFGLVGEGVARALNPLLWTAPKQRRRALRGAPAPADPGAAAAADAPTVSGTALSPPVAANGTVLQVDDLVVRFPAPTGSVDIVKGVSLSLREGEVLGLVGESGSGKTMTALAVAQLTQFPGQVGGRVLLHGEDLRQLSKKQLDRVLGTDLAVVYQDPSSSLNPALRIGTQVTEAVRVHKKLKRREADELAIAGLGEMHIAAPERQLRRYPHEFSGGMRQRVMIAKGLIKEPSLLIADEPTTALDVTVQAQIMDVLHEINESHRTAIILISHNLALVSQSCDRVAVMYSGRVVEELRADQLRDGALHPYTRALLATVPELDHARDRALQSIPGEIPDIANPPTGCPYHPRCPLAMERCRTVRPELLNRPDDPDRRVACHVANEDVDPDAAARVPDVGTTK